MEPSCFRLLAMYSYLLVRRARQQGIRRRVTIPKIVGAIVTRSLLAHQERIIDEYQKAKLQGFCTPRDLRAALPTDLATLISDLQSAGDAGTGPPNGP